ncbi:MAG TPA: hypothetical protein VGU64_04200 [Terriglobales bacterium]|nr:hypothetical protein [Terriglobales bacterium]
MRRSARIGFAAAFLLAGVTVAIAQNGPATGGYPPARWNPNLSHGYYGYSGYYGRPRYRLVAPYYVLGYPVPHYSSYRPWRDWR